MPPSDNERHSSFFDELFSSQVSGVLHVPDPSYKFIDDWLDDSEAKWSPSILDDSFERSQLLSSDGDEIVPTQPSLQQSTPTPKYPTMGTVAPPRWKFSCPIFEAQKCRGLRHTCNGIRVDNMSEVRRHMTRSYRGHPPHLPFLKLCPTCNEDFIDKDLFETCHGILGEHCHNPRPQRKGAARVDQWKALYNLVVRAFFEGPYGSWQAVNSPGPGRSPFGHPGVIMPQGRLFDMSFEPMMSLCHPGNQRLFYYTSPGHEFHQVNEKCILSSSSDTKSSDDHPEVLFNAEWTSNREKEIFSNVAKPCILYNKGYESDRERFQSNWGNKSISNHHITWRQLGHDVAISETLSSASTSTLLCTSRSTCRDSPGRTRRRSPGIQNAGHSELSFDQSQRSKDEVPNTIHCCEARCSASFTGIYRQGNLARHKRLKHGICPATYYCQERGCWRKYKRQDARLKHYRKHHPHLASLAIMPEH